MKKITLLFGCFIGLSGAVMAQNFAGGDLTGVSGANGAAGSATEALLGRAPVTITHNNSQTIVDELGLTCQSGGITTDNRLAGVFNLSADFGINVDWEIQSVEFGVDEVLGAPGDAYPVTVNAYTTSTTDPNGTLTLLGSTNITIGSADALSVVAAPMPAGVVVPAGGILVIVLDVFNDGATGFRLGATDVASNDDSWILAVDCGLTSFGTYASLGFGDRWHVMNVVGEDVGGGTGVPCETSAPGNAFENGKSFTMNLGRIVAHDITVNADEDFTLEVINLNAFIGASGSGVNAGAVDVYIYSDAGGSPGAIITSEIGMAATSQVVVGSNFGFDVWDVELDITDVLLPSQVGVPTTYWVGVSLEPTDASNTFWENSTAGLVGFGEAYDDGLGGGFVIDNTLEGVYTFSGTCGGTAGVSENSLDGFAYYPNPTSDILSLKSVNSIDSVAIYNLLGQRVIDTKIGATTSDINLSGLTAGTYIMKVVVDGQTGTFKVLKN